MLRFLLAVLASALVASAADSPLKTQLDALLRQRQWADVQSIAEKATVATPTDAEAWHYLGLAHLAHNAHEAAVTALEKAATLAPTNSEYQRVLGDAYGASAIKAGLFSKLAFARKCQAAYQHAVDLDPTNVAARWSLMEYFRQAPSIAGGGIDKAYGQADEIKKIDANRGRIALATLYVSDRKAVEAFGLFDEALKENPDDYVALYQLGRLSAMTGQRLDEGIVNLRKCLTLPAPAGQPGPAPVNWRLGQLFEKKGDKPAARSAYEAARSADPNFTPVLESLRKLDAG